jgi:hypothetical protein
MDFSKRELELLKQALDNWLSDLTRHEHELTEELRALDEKVGKLLQAETG